VSKSDVFDILGVSLLAVFAFALWPPLCLLVFGVAALWVGWAS
jgi:glucose uptake protein GlcU